MRPLAESLGGCALRARGRALLLQVVYPLPRLLHRLERLQCKFEATASRSMLSHILQPIVNIDNWQVGKLSEQGSGTPGWAQSPALKCARHSPVSLKQTCALPPSASASRSCVVARRADSVAFSRLACFTAAADAARDACRPPRSHTSYCWRTLSGTNPRLLPGLIAAGGQLLADVLAGGAAGCGCVVGSSGCTCSRAAAGVLGALKPSEAPSEPRRLMPLPLRDGGRLPFCREPWRWPCGWWCPLAAATRRAAIAGASCATRGEASSSACAMRRRRHQVWVSDWGCFVQQNISMCTYRARGADCRERTTARLGVVGVHHSVLRAAASHFVGCCTAEPEAM